MQTKILIVILVVVVVGILIWFAASKQSEPVPAAKEPIKIGIIIYPGMGPLYVAEEKGFFEEEGVDVEIIQIPDENQLVSSLAGNEVQMLESTADFSTIFADAGIDAQQIFATDIGFGSDGLVVKDDINNIAELKGKKVNLSLGTPSHFLFRFLAEREGLKGGDVEFVNTTADQVGAGFMAGQIDYGVTWEPWLSKASEREDGKVLITSREAPGIITDTILARGDLIENRREDVKGVMRAFFKAVEFWRNNPQEATAIAAKRFNLTAEEFAPLMETVKLLDYNENLKKFDESTELNIFELSEKAVEFYLEDGVIQSQPSVNNLIDASLLKELY